MPRCHEPAARRDDRGAPAGVTASRRRGGAAGSRRRTRIVLLSTRYEHSPWYFALLIHACRPSETRKPTGHEEMTELLAADPARRAARSGVWRHNHQALVPATTCRWSDAGWRTIYPTNTATNGAAAANDSNGRARRTHTVLVDCWKRLACCMWRMRMNAVVQQGCQADHCCCRFSQK